MRLVQVIIPEGKKEDITGLLEEKSIDYVVTSETSQREYSDVLFFPIPTEGVEEILDDLREVGLEQNGFTVVTKAEAVVAEKFEELKQQYEKSDEVDATRVARQELKASAKKISPQPSTYYLLTIAAAVIAAAGILLDNTAIVVGSMVIAPLIGPAMASCVGTVIDDNEIFYHGVQKQILGTVVAIASSALFARVALSLLVSPDLDLHSLGQVAQQLHPGILSLVVALGSGLAGALSLTSGINSALVGVMIAVALLPPAATVGVGIASASLPIAAGASTLLIVNVISINLAGTITLWLQGYKPGLWYEQKGAEQSTKKRGVFLLVLLLLVATFLGFLTWEMHQNAKLKKQITTTATQTIKEKGGEVLSTELHWSQQFLFQQLTGLKMWIGGGQPPKDWANSLKQQLETATGKTLEIKLIYETVSQTR